MTSRILKILAIIAVASLVAACKVAVVVVEGGHVEALNSPDCLVGTNCIFNVPDTNFSESFTAVPAPGWQFVKWNSGEGFFCSNSVNPTCSLSLAGTSGNAAIEALVASSKTFYIMPIFERLPGGLPITDTITVDGKEWAQPDQFRNLQWHDMNAVCPAGICNGILNGYEMAGWSWASVEQINSLLNYYIGSQQLGSGPSEANNVSQAAFWGDGWRPTRLWYIHPYGGILAAFTNECSRYLDPTNPDRYVARYGGMSGAVSGTAPNGNLFWNLLAFTTGATYHSDSGCITHTYNEGLPPDTSAIGGWFYRTP